MAQNYQKIGDYISVLDNRNADGSISNLTGISIDKCYIPSVANVIGTDLNNYKVIRKGQFACSLMQVSRDQRIPLAMYTSDEPAIMSPAYVMFEVNRPDELLPEYMDLWFKRAEFDREASFYAVGGVRGSLDWEDFCKMKLPVPPISEQRKIVHDYKVITDRIELLRKMNEKLYSYLNEQFERIVSDVTSFVPLSALCDYVTDKEDFGNLPEQNYLSTENLLQNKQGIAGFGEAEDDTRVTCFQAEDTLISNIRPYFKKIWFATVSGGCNADVLCFRAHDSKDACLVNAVLYQNKFFDYVMSGAKGTKMPRGDKSHIMQYPVPVLTKEKKGEFLSFADKIQSLQAVNKKEIDVLQRLMVLSVSNIAKGA